MPLGRLKSRWQGFSRCEPTEAHPSISFDFLFEDNLAGDLAGIVPSHKGRPNICRNISEHFRKKICSSVNSFVPTSFCRRATLRLLNALNSEDRGLKVRFSLATIVFETFELILCQMLSSQGKNAPSNPYPHYLVRLATSRHPNKVVLMAFLTPLQTAFWFYNSPAVLWGR